MKKLKKGPIPKGCVAIERKQFCSSFYGDVKYI
jgi:hypothetical protein